MGGAAEKDAGFSGGGAAEEGPGRAEEVDTGIGQTKRGGAAEERPGRARRDRGQRAGLREEDPPPGRCLTAFSWMGRGRHAGIPLVVRGAPGRRDALG